MSANHARESECELEIAATADGRILGLRGHAFTNHGAYIRTNGSVAPRNIAQFSSGPYRVENIDITATMLVTNKTPSGTYRGPGRFEGDFFRERLIDLMAKDLGIDRVEIRRRNLVTDAEMPFRLADITPYDHSDELDSGDNPELLDRCLADFGWQEKAKLAGKLIDGVYHGIAVGCFIEGGGAGPSEEARFVLETRRADHALHGLGRQSARASRRSWRRSPATRSRCRSSGSRVLHGSTSHVAEGFGSYHSRSTVMGGNAILIAAEKLKERIRAAAAAKLGCAAAEVVLDGEARARRVARRWRSPSVADQPIEAAGTFHNHKHTYSYGTQAAHVTVDPGTGQVDGGRPRLDQGLRPDDQSADLKGQAIGSMVQGLGGTFLEDLVYDDAGPDPDRLVRRLSDAVARLLPESAARRRSS